MNDLDVVIDRAVAKATDDYRAVLRWTLTCLHATAQERADALLMLRRLDGAA